MATLGLSRSGGLDLFSQSMTGAPVIRFGLAAMLSLALSTPGRGADTETVEPTQLLMMSDLHFDPMADPKLVDRHPPPSPRNGRAFLKVRITRRPLDMAPTAIGRCSIRLFGKRRKHCRALLSSYCQAIFLRTIFAASSTPLRRITRMRLACRARCIGRRTWVKLPVRERWHIAVPPGTSSCQTMDGAIAAGADRASDEILTRIRGVSTSRPT